MCKWFLSLIFLTIATAQTSISESFPGMQPLLGVEYEKFSDPTDIMSAGFSEDINAIEPDGIGYRYFISEGYPPSILHEDVCPSGYETVWYTYESPSPDPIIISFRSQISELINGEVDFENMENNFAPVFREAQRTATGQTSFMAPVYIGHCSYSETRGDWYRYHEATIESTGMGDVSCQFLMNNSGKQTVISESSAPYYTFCDGEQ